MAARRGEQALVHRGVLDLGVDSEPARLKQAVRHGGLRPVQALERAQHACHSGTEIARLARSMDEFGWIVLSGLAMCAIGLVGSVTPLVAFAAG